MSMGTNLIGLIGLILYPKIFYEILPKGFELYEKSIK